eukprot:CAMPEP_0204254738 /NCGR_PEP_ID=MMETSP0468-20130131/2744_1 /ASSEMBLY_ACC=CAM_ASM_000383 /TAXON_ID=2969 /ORGANISM="Oxyrrhis marina" /LENGTH=278 /DNA_ID=CAMNT_0051228515 /DNA_START=11 /DNA_END=847 /DNA_ORIENTATION=-
MAYFTSTPVVGHQMLIKNTFLQVEQDRPCLDEKRFASAPAGFILNIEEWDCETSEDGTEPESMSSGCSTQDGKALDTGSDIGTDAASHAPEVSALLEELETAVLENLRLEPTGTMSLATMGNRISKVLVKQLRGHGIKFSKYVRSMERVSVQGAEVTLLGEKPIVSGELPRVCRRGEFLHALRSDRLPADELDNVYYILQCVHELLSKSDRDSESPCALGNKLAPRARALLSARRARLIEIVSEFPQFFTSVVVRAGGAPHIGLVSRSVPLTRQVLGL